MAIVSHTVATTTQESGSTHNVVRMVDGDGHEYMASFFLPNGADLSAKVAALIASTEAQLADSEFEQLIGEG